MASLSLICLLALAASAAQQPTARITITGRVIARPTGGELWIVRDGTPLPTSPTTLAAEPQYATRFAPADLATWRADVGAMRAEAAGLIVSGDRSILVMPSAAVGDVRLTAEFRADRVGGILLRYRDSGSFILAFYSPIHKTTGFHDVRKGNYGPWVSPVSTAQLRGETVRMTVEIEGAIVRSIVEGDRGGPAVTSCTLAPDMLPGIAGLYYDNLSRLGPQEFRSFRVEYLARRPITGAIRLAVAAGQAPVLCRGDRVRITAERAGSDRSDPSDWSDPSDVLRVPNWKDIKLMTSTNRPNSLFPTRLPSCEWRQFPAAGYTKPVCGVVYRLGDTVTNGMALGGIDTGCLDLETTGLLGYCTLFNTHVPRRGPINVPILGMSVGGKTWVLCDPKPKEGSGGAQTPIEPGVSELKLDGVSTANEIHYWGHYPVADLEFETDAPIQAGLRAWSPFYPGDTVGSMMPAMVFEVRLRNPGNEARKGTLAFSFPGPTSREAGTETFRRSAVAGKASGVRVDGPKASYVAAVIGGLKPRTGGELGADGAAWARIGSALPDADPAHPGASLAVDFALAPGASRTVRFVVTWHAPTWKGGGYNWSDAGGTFTHMYAKRYPDPVRTAETVAADHAVLLRRVLAWQQVIYTDAKLPVWLRDSLVNVLYMIAEDGYWAQKTGALPAWVKAEDGLFGLNECPRGCPQIECIPCSFYGSLPLAYLFPDLQLSTIRGYAGYQLADGAPPWIFGGCTGQTPPIDFASPTRGYQFASNGISLAAIVDRFLLCRDTPDRKLLKELYPMVKRSVEHTITLRTTPSYSIGERVISMPDGNVGTEWFEAPEPGWCGMTAHIGGLHLAEIRIAERMAREVGDAEFASRCAGWIAAGVEAMEKHLWDPKGYYRNYVEPETGQRSDLVFGYQLDGEWVNAHHGLPNALAADRIKTILTTLKRTNVAVTKYGAVNYANADGTVANPGGYGAYSYFPPELLMLAMTYMYNGEREFGLDLAHRAWQNIVCRQGYTWDMPNIMRGDVDTGERTFGNDYYQDMMLWALPAALEGQTVEGPCKRGGLVERVMRAARPKAR